MKFSIDITEREVHFSPPSLDQDPYPGEPPVTQAEIDNYMDEWERSLQYQNYFRAVLLDESSAIMKHKSIESPRFFRGDKSSKQEKDAMLASMMEVVSHTLRKRFAETLSP